MQIYNDLKQIAAPFDKAYVTIGNFDGVHLGHQILFSEVVSKAYRHGGTSIAITFEPHPLKIVRPDRGIKLISTYEQKVELIELANIDLLIVLPFSKQFAAMRCRRQNTSRESPPERAARSHRSVLKIPGPADSASSGQSYIRVHI